MDGGGGGGGGERWAPSGRQLTASLVGLNVFVVLLIYYYMWRFFSGKSDGGVPGGGGGDDEDAESSAAPSRAVSPKARDREAMELAITALPVFVVHVPTPGGDDGGGAGDAAAAADANGGGGGGGKALECAICIAEFADGEEGRLLPRCGHRFHARCVDMWFQLHSTCPLCRAGVLPPAPAPAPPCPTTAPHDDDGQQQVVAPPPDHTDDTNRTDNCPV